MGSRISRLFNGLMLYILFLLTFHIPVAEEGLFLHQTQVSTGIMYISHIFLWGGSLIMHSTWRTTIFYAFSNNYQTAFIYHMWIPAVKSMCVWRICMPLRTYMWNVHEVEVEWPFQSALHFLSTYLVWYVWWVVHGMSLWWRSRSRRLPHKTEDSRQNTYIYIYMNADVSSGAGTCANTFPLSTRKIAVLFDSRLCVSHSRSWHIRMYQPL